MPKSGKRVDRVIETDVLIVGSEGAGSPAALEAIKHGVEIHVEEAPDRLQDLLNWGVKIDGLIQASGHSYPRGVVIPGTKLMPHLRRAVLSTDVELVCYTMITDLLTTDGCVVGAVGINGATGEVLVFKA